MSPTPLGPHTKMSLAAKTPYVVHKAPACNARHDPQVRAEKGRRLHCRREGMGGGRARGAQLATCEKVRGARIEAESRVLSTVVMVDSGEAKRMMQMIVANMPVAWLRAATVAPPKMSLAHSKRVAAAPPSTVAWKDRSCGPGFMSGSMVTIW